jgi:hypothetical protein
MKNIQRRDHQLQLLLSSLTASAQQNRIGAPEACDLLMHSLLECSENRFTRPEGVELNCSHKQNCANHDQNQTWQTGKIH